jgi:hypothetical protein
MPGRAKPTPASPVLLEMQLVETRGPSGTTVSFQALDANGVLSTIPAGTRFMAALVELKPHAESLPNYHPLVQRATVLAVDPEFQGFLIDTYTDNWRATRGSPRSRAECAIQSICRVRARDNLAEDEHARERFLKLVRHFDEWRRQRPDN